MILILNFFGDHEVCDNFNEPMKLLERDHFFNVQKNRDGCELEGFCYKNNRVVKFSWNEYVILVISRELKVNL